MITSDTVDRACTEVSAYSEDQLASEFERFFKNQPDLCDFVVDLTNDSDQRIQELSLFLSYMVFKAVEMGRPAEITSVSSGTIEAAFRESESWIEMINGSEIAESDSSVVSSFAADSEPYLLQYVISELNQPLEDGSELGDEQKGEVFFVLKTVISSLSGRTFETKEKTTEE
jgi:hypothetical protein